LARVRAGRCLVACFQGDLPQAERHAAEALRGLAPEDAAYRAGIHHSLGDTYRQASQWEKARLSYRAALSFTRDPVYPIRSIHVSGALADLELLQGRLSQAAAWWQEALAAALSQASWGKLPLPLTGWMYIRLGEIFYEWNQLAEAAEHGARGLERAELGGDVAARLAGYLLAARLGLAGGDLAAAEDYLGRAWHVLEKSPLPGWSSRCWRIQLALWLAQNRPAPAARQVKKWLAKPDLLPEGDREPVWLAMAHTLLIQGDRLDLPRAEKILRSCLKAGQETGRLPVEIEARALLALLQSRQGRPAAALEEMR
jgi:tetratricopeptide (TPR) repeat protein